MSRSAVRKRTLPLVAHLFKTFKPFKCSSLTSVLPRVAGEDDGGV